MADQPVKPTAASRDDKELPLVLGLDTFGDRTNSASGQPLSVLIDEIRAAARAVELL